MMKFYIFIVLIAVTCCQGAPQNEPIEAKETFFDKKLRTFLENFRNDMKLGITFYENKTLDPLNIDRAEFGINQPHLIEMNATVNDLLLLRLSEYQVKLAKLSMTGFKMSAGLLWNEINFKTGYDMRGLIADNLKIFGKGNITNRIENLYFQISLKLKILETYAQIEIQKTVINLTKFEFKITGLFEDEELSEFLSKLISNMVPDLLKNHQDDITPYLNKFLEDTVNEKLKHISLSSILGVIS